MKIPRYHDQMMFSSRSEKFEAYTAILLFLSSRLPRYRGHPPSRNAGHIHVLGFQDRSC